MSTRQAWKCRVQSILRAIHLTALHRGLPDRLAVYLHSLEPSDHDAFCALIEELGARGYRFVRAGDYAGPTTGRVAFISFDDNYRAWHDSLSLFDALGVRATFYVNTLPWDASPRVLDDYYDRLAHGGDRAPLTAEAARELHAAGHEIGAHGHRHLYMSRVSPDEARRDIDENRQRLQEAIRAPVRHFAVPFGVRRAFDRGLESHCARVGLRTVAYATPGLLHRPFDGFHLHRSGYEFGRTQADNLRSFGVDGHVFVALTGRSPVG